MNVINIAELQALLGSIQTSLGNVSFPPFRSRSACGTAYEVYIFGLLLEEAVNAGADQPVFSIEIENRHPSHTNFGQAEAALALQMIIHMQN